ncbi:uncharacterized protein LOC108626954 isoform X3 [Ceratina calcarata]|uniref:Uncharacterized protein LOC108626954 isoform X3 n=1 Tax=Ceratina calcarata TaxID=156304 RepID=A0AAJ7J2W3_9HYME|nr:uncharacterized protein LOC108626954 isoform X3 [Ceratina calcarata]
MNMIRESFLFIWILVAGIKCDARARYRKDLNSDLDGAFNFFEEIKSNYGSKSSLNEDELAKIDREITEYVRKASNIVSNRRRRQSTSSNAAGINVLDGFVDIARFDHDGMRDMELFSLGHEDAVWFAAVLDDRKVSVHRITMNEESLNAEVASYPVTNGTRFVVNGCACGALLIIEHRNGSVLVLNFTKVPNDADDDDYALRASDQDLELNSTTDLAIWNGIGMNQLYLGIATRSNVSVYTWLGKYFDPTQVIGQGAKKLIPFRSRGSMHLAVITADSAATLIFRHFLESNQFLLIQRLPSSRDASFFEFQFKHGRFADRFLCLSTESSSIVYKQTHDRFVPFQRIPLYVRFIVPIVSIPRKTVLLFGIREAAMTVAYQYDGWRFVRSNSSTLAVDQFRPVYDLHGNELLLLTESGDNGQWTLKRPVWVRRNSYENFRDEAKRWIVEANTRARRTIVIGNTRQPVRISKGRIGRLRATNVDDSQKLVNVSREYEKLISKFEQRSDHSPRGTLTIDSVRAQKIRAKCESNCNANRLYGENLRGIGKMSKSRTKTSSNYHRLLNVGEVKEWKCPFMSLPMMDDVNVRGSINGVLLNDLQDRAFKVVGDQRVSGEHVFANLNATDVYAPLNIAVNFTSQRLIVKHAEAKRLKLTTAYGLLLPLNGSSSTITGSIETDQVTVDRIRLNGKPIGHGTRRLRPVIVVDESMLLNDNFTTENVKIENLAVARLIDEKSGGSVETVFENAISLRDDRVPVSLIFSSKKTKWSNVVVVGGRGGPWVARNSSRNSAAIGTVSGKKHFPRDVEISKFSRYFPKIRANLCGNYVIAPEIETMLAITNGTVNNVTGTRAFGRLDERHSVSSFNFVFPGSERRRNVTATNVLATRVDGMIQETKELGNLWFDRDSLLVDASSFDAMELTGNSLLSPVRLNVELTAGTIRARRTMSEKNGSVRIVNEIDLNDFSVNAIKIEQMISLANVKFRDGFNAGCVHVFRRSSYTNDIVTTTSTNTDARHRLGRKNVLGHVETNAINAPQRSFQITPSNRSPIKAIVQGSARFSREPRIKTTNDVLLDERQFGRIWLTTDDGAVVFRGARLHFRDAVRLGNAFAAPGSPASTVYDPETWKNVSRRVFSRTRSQEIRVGAFLKHVRARTVVAASNDSTMKCSSTDFGDEFENSLLKNVDREVWAKWTFDEINVTEALYVAGNAINDLDLGNDVARYDSQENAFSGKKTVLTVTAENFHGYNLQEWFANALPTGTKRVSTLIEGSKTFKGSACFDAGVTVTTAGIISVDDSLLSKSANQTIYGRKEIRGFLDASELIANGLVNEVNLTELTNRQLKKGGFEDDDDDDDDDHHHHHHHERRLRRIKTSIEFRNGLSIVNGGLTINGRYANAETSNLYASYTNQASPIVHAIEKLYLTAETIVAAFANRAMYLSKLEIVKDAATLNVSGLPTTLEGIRCGEATHFSTRCKPITDFGFRTSDDFVLLRSSVVNGEEFIVLVKQNSVSIFSSADGGPPIHSRVPILDLHISRIMDAFLEETRHSLWIVLRLSSHTLILRYRPYRRVVLDSYVLPGSDAFATSRSPNGQLLLVSSDGLWNLGGLASPRNIVRIPFEERIEIIRVSRFDYYLKSISPGNRTTVMKARYATTAN